MVTGIPSIIIYLLLKGYTNPSINQPMGKGRQWMDIDIYWILISTGYLLEMKYSQSLGDVEKLDIYQAQLLMDWNPI